MSVNNRHPGTCQLSQDALHYSLRVFPALWVFLSLGRERGGAS